MSEIRCFWMVRILVIFFFSAFLGFSMFVQQARSFDNENHKGADVLTGAGASVIPTSSHRTLWNMVSLRTGQRNHITWAHCTNCSWQSRIGTPHNTRTCSLRPRSDLTSSLVPRPFLTEGQDQGPPSSPQHTSALTGMAAIAIRIYLN